MRIEPDLKFIKYLKGAGGDTLKKCYQCATCSVVCPLATDDKPFPRKEMIWAQWGMRDKLMADADVMLCHQCGDCTAYCPRGAKPGDVLGAIRAYAYTHFGWPQGLARFVSNGKNLPLIIGLPALLVLVVWFLSGGMRIPEGPVDFGYFFGKGNYFGLTKTVLVIDALFVPAFLFAIYAAYRGVSNMWRSMSAELPEQSEYRPSVKQFVTDFLWPSVKETLAHKRFNECGANKSRTYGHMPLMFSFIALLMVTGYSFVRKDIVGYFNPAMHGPIPMTDPFKILANIAAIALIVGIVIIWVNRSRMEEAGKSSATYYDWFLIGMIAAVGVSGLGAQMLRLIDIPVLAYLFYYLHLVSVLMLFFYMPYTKFAHMVYRTFAMAFEKYRASSFVPATKENVKPVPKS
jgi:quinone-modifying oxidoreductase, subunit QmoC